MNEKMKSLVVDDEKVIRDGCHRVLTGKGYEVLTVENGQQAMDTLAEKPVDIILLDLKMPVIIGLQKSGYVVEYMQLLNRHIPTNRLFSITDEFRYNYLGIERSKNGFGSETYYGHDFAVKTRSGKLFIFGLPYPFPTKSTAHNFLEEKANMDHYLELQQALSLITQVETDLYRDALVPIALAHRYTAISLRPGGRVLDVMGRSAQANQR